jgi:pimeloyl-ACP methyl ester carboxylesterase
MMERSDESAAGGLDGGSWMGDRDALVSAEQRLYSRLGLEHRSRRIALASGPVHRARILEMGDGPPVLFVHGAGMVGSLWAPLLVALSGRRRITVDLPGCGLTDAFDHRGIDLREHARSFLAAVLDTLDLDAVPVVANSLGATYSLYLAAAEPHRLSHMVLLGAPGVALAGGRASRTMALYSHPAVSRLLAAVSPPVTPRLARRLLTGICGRPAVESVPDEMFEVAAAAMRISDPTTRTLVPELFAGRVPRSPHALTDHELARIVTPTRFVWARDDIFQSPSTADRAVTLMAAADLTVVAGGHHPWWNDPAGCGRIVDEHLAA